MSRLGILFMRLLAHAAAGLDARAWAGCWAGSCTAWCVPRRHVVQTSIWRCAFRSGAQRSAAALVPQVFVHVAQAWLDRSLAVACATRRSCAQRLELTGAVQRTGRQRSPPSIFAPHFVGLDAGWTALTQQVPRRFIGIYTDQSNKVVDAWVLQGPAAASAARGLSAASTACKTIVSRAARGAPLYLLPDMNFGPEESIFVPFYGVPAATVPSLSRFARLGRAKVVPVVTRMTPQGYEVQVLPAWDGFPDRATSRRDTALMNQRLQGYIDDDARRSTTGCTSASRPARPECRRSIERPLARAPRAARKRARSLRDELRLLVHDPVRGALAPSPASAAGTYSSRPSTSSGSSAASSMRPQHQRGQVHGEHFARQRDRRAAGSSARGGPQRRGAVVVQAAGQAARPTPRGIAAFTASVSQRRAAPVA